MKPAGLAYRFSASGFIRPRGSSPASSANEAEEDAVEEVRHRRRLDPPVAQAPGQAREPAGRLLGDEGAHHVRAQAVRVVEQRTEEAQRLQRLRRPLGQVRIIKPVARLAPELGAAARPAAAPGLPG